MMEDPNPFDLVTLRIDPERIRQPTKPKKWRRQFVHVPWHWIERLQTTRRVSTYRLAFVLLYEHWRTGGRPIVLSNVGLQQEGVARRSKWNALAELQDLGLIAVTRRTRKSPHIVLRHLSGPT
jgi:hypothetical protein